MHPLKLCLHCRVNRVKPPKVRFCSPACGKAYYRTPKGSFFSSDVCKFCKGPKIEPVGKRSLYCSQKCKRDAVRQSWRASARRRRNIKDIGIWDPPMTTQERIARVWKDARTSTKPKKLWLPPNWKDPSSSKRD